jgi:hypothetical protein
VSETFFKGAAHNNNAIGLKGYNVFRNDRLKEVYMRMGGVAIFVKSQFKCKIVATSKASDMAEYLFLEVAVNSTKLLLGVVYRPPGLNCVPEIRNVLAQMTACYDQIIVMGDFNINMLSNDSESIGFSSFLTSLKLRVINTEPTHFRANSATLIDFIIVSESNLGLVKATCQIDLPGVTEHDLLWCAYDLSPCDVGPTTYSFRDYSRVNLDGLFFAAHQLTWNEIYTSTNVDYKANRFTDFITDLYNEFVPLKTKTVVNNQTPWINEEITHLMSQRDIFYRIWKSSKNEANWNEFKKHRNLVKNKLTYAKRQYMANFLDLKQPSNKLWKNIKSLGLSKSTNAVITANCEDLKNHFSRVQTSGFGYAEPVPRSSIDGFAFRNVSDVEVEKAILSVKSNAIGLDEIPLRFIKLLLPIIMPALSHIFNSCLTFSEFPKLWKVGKIIPIAKVALPNTVDDYRPITILPAVSKALEKLIKNQIVDYLSQNNLLCKYQSGFREGHCTTTTVLKVIDDLSAAIDSRQLSVLALLDFSKAFDLVNHNLLLNKLQNQFRFSNSAVNLIKAYISDRAQVVFSNGEYSQKSCLLTGVPQGSVLGPILFSLFINDISECIQYCKYHLYADDLQIYNSRKKTDFAECVNEVNEDLENIKTWSINNGLRLNVSKTQAMIVSGVRIANQHFVPPPLKLDGQIIPYSDKVTDLGIIIEKNLGWESQVLSITRKTYATLRRLWNAADFLSTNMRLRLVRSLIVPFFTYGDVVFSRVSGEHLRLLQVSFNSCARFVHSLRRYDHISHVSSEILGCTLTCFYKYKDCLLVRNLLKNGQPKYLRELLNTGVSSRSQNLILPRCSSVLRSKTFFASGPSAYNSLPTAIKTMQSEKGFKTACIDYFTSQGT